MQVILCHSHTQLFFTDDAIFTLPPPHPWNFWRDPPRCHDDVFTLLCFFRNLEYLSCVITLLLLSIEAYHISICITLQYVLLLWLSYCSMTHDAWQNRYNYVTSNSFNWTLMYYTANELSLNTCRPIEQKSR